MLNINFSNYFFLKKSFYYINKLLWYYQYALSANRYKKIYSKIYNIPTVNNVIISLEDLYLWEVEFITEGINIDFKIYLYNLDFNFLIFKIKNIIFYIFENNFIINNIIIFSIIKNFNTFTRINFNYILTKYTLNENSSIFMVNYKFIDHVRYFNIKIQNTFMLDKYPAIKLLSQRYGFGTKMSSMVLKYLGISSIFVPNLLPINNFYHKLSFFFSSRLLKLDNYLMNFYILKHTFLKKIKVYRGFRLLRGYPVSGQRTRSNYKTSSKKPYFYSFYFI